MKKVLAALVAAAFSLSIAGTAMAVPAQVNQEHSSISQVQDQATPKKKKKPPRSRRRRRSRPPRSPRRRSSSRLSRF